MESLPSVANGLRRDDRTLMAELLAALQRMLRRDHLPTPTLLVRLTDGRIRLNTTPRNADEARHYLVRLCNEYGPAQAAFWISVDSHWDGIHLAVESLISPQPLRLEAPAVRFQAASAGESGASQQPQHASPHTPVGVTGSPPAVWSPGAWLVAPR